MRIIQISPCYVDIYKETSGVANIIREICLACEVEKIETILICPNTELGRIVAKTGIHKYSDNLTIYILHQRTNPLFGPISPIRNLISSFKEIDLVHIHTCFSFITEYAMRYFLNSTPIIFTPHGKLSPASMKNYFFFKKLIFNYFTKQSLNKISELVSSSVNEIYFTEELGIICRKSYIYNGYRNNLSTEYQHNIDIKPKKFLLFLGYLDPRKQPDLLIRAFSKSKAKDSFKLVLAGPDSYNFKSFLEAEIKACGMESGKDVLFTGKVIGELKWQLLKNAKALLLPSKAEGWPVVLAEAIGAEIPSVISKGCNFDEIEELNIGLLVDNFEEKSWAEAIDRVCFDTSLEEMHRFNLMKYKDQFSWDAITLQWLAKYEKIIKESKP